MYEGALRNLSADISEVSGMIYIFKRKKPNRENFTWQSCPLEPSYTLPIRDSLQLQLQLQGHTQTESEGMGKDIPWKWKPKGSTGSYIYIRQTDCKPKTVTKDKVITK